MTEEQELELLPGGYAKLPLAAAGEFPSFYVFSMDYSGSAQFWELLSRLMAAAGRPLCAVHEAAQPNGFNPGGVTPSAMRQLLRRDGYGFGIFFDAGPALKEIVPPGHTKFLFLRDPRNVLVATYLTLARQNGSLGARFFAEFVQSPVIERVLGRYRDFVELWRREPGVTLFRYEHARSGWREIAAEIVAKLSLPIDPLTAASIAAIAPAPGDRLPFTEKSPARHWDRPEIAELEARFADVLAALGYPPEKSKERENAAEPQAQAANAAPPVHTAPTVTEPPRAKLVSSPVAPAVDDRPSGPQVLPRVAGIFESDPVLMSRLKPNTSAEICMLGRRIILDVDATGCRPVTGQPAVGEKTLAVYGCSFTYGSVVAADETFCSVLQGMFPAWRVENYGVSGYGTLQNAIQLERNTRWNKPELVTFCWIPNHLIRNAADIYWAKNVTRNNPTGPERRMPRAELDSDGSLHIRSIAVPRVDLLDIDVADFTGNAYYLELLCFRLLERANAIVRGYGGHFFVTVLWGQMSATFAGRLAEIGIPVVDASLSGNEYVCAPDDPHHPNALANRKYAERMAEYLRQRTAEHRVAVANGPE